LRRACQLITVGEVLDVSQFSGNLFRDGGEIGECGDYLDPAIAKNVLLDQGDHKYQEQRYVTFDHLAAPSFLHDPVS
jgi:hypothetical protein